MTQFIVAEVTKNWAGEWVGDPPPPEDCLCGRFEKVIEVNRRRGYRLHSFTMHRLMTGPETMNESIVAVFEKC